ncbi:MAG: peroxiredoxin family protein [Planctomycetes bacterium]|nr:peroxiredoxin family protein [Planctomycetota bacterium]
MCRSELRDLVEVDSELKRRGGGLLAISVDAPQDSQRVVQDLALPFRILSDSERAVTRAYGLMHENGGPEGETIAVPAQLLVDRDGTIVWKHVARRITDRAHPARTLEALAQLRP